MARYFQHLNSQNSDFQKVTELQYIDDTDPDFILYYFKDGTKCNKAYVGALNEKDVYGRCEFVEVSSPNNRWEFDVVEVKREQPKKRYETGADGQVYEVPSEYDYTQSKAQEGKRVTVKRSPEFVKPKEDNETYSAPANIPAKPTTIDEAVIVEPKELPAPDNVVIASQNSMQSEYIIDAEYLLDKNKNVSFVYNGTRYSMPAKQFFDNAILDPSEKVVEKVVEKEVVKQVAADHIAIGLDDQHKGVVDNMIDMAQKETCAIEMEVTLSLPPVSLYKIIKSVYSPDMAIGFVNIIADRMETKELKSAVARGLLAYYDEDDSVNVEDSQDTSEEPVKKSTRKKA